MDTTFLIVQIIGIFTIFITSISFFQKQKWKMMLCLMFTNVLLSVTYVLCGDLIGGLLVAGALLRTIIYFLYSKINKKPEPIVMVLFQMYNVIISVLFWKGITNLFIILNLLVVTYTTWQDDLTTLRLGYVISSVLLCTYDILLKAYTTSISEIIMLISVLVALIKYRNITKNYKNVCQRYFNAYKYFWGCEIIDNKSYDLILSPPNNSPYYNFAVVKNYDNIVETLKEIKGECKKHKIPETAYLPFNSKNYNVNTDAANTLSMFFPIVYKDVWMKLKDGLNVNNTKCKIKDVEFVKIDNSKIDDLIETYIKGYLDKTNKKSLNEEEKSTCKYLKNLKLNQEDAEYKTHAYIAYYKSNPVAMLCTISNKVECFITKVSTIPIFRRKYVASSLIQYCINKERDAGVQNFILLTDKDSIAEKFYKHNNFVEFGQAFALNIEDDKKYKDFLKTNKL